MAVGVGIDLGTTNSCVAVVQGDEARVITDKDGHHIQPSVVSFHADGTALAGFAAKKRLLVDPENTITSFKRLLGRNIESDEIQEFLKDLPYKVKAGPGNIPAVEVRGKDISLPEVSAMMLKHLRELASERLGVEITDAVITVPANFNDVQRSLTKVAGRIAGFNVLRILNEPTAAALAYGFGNELTERVAIYDFGGGTFDISIVELTDEIFEVLSTAGDSYLGGNDLDEAVARAMFDKFLQKHRCDLRDDAFAAQRVLTVAEKIKCQLSSLEEVQATLREIAYGEGGAAFDAQFRFTRPEFTQLINPLVERSLNVCGEAMELAGIDKASLDSIVLVGGSTRVPVVRERVSQYFAMTPHTEINPDEVVAIGAAIHAFALTGEQLPAPDTTRPVIIAPPANDSIPIIDVRPPMGGGSPKTSSPDDDDTMEVTVEDLEELNPDLSPTGAKKTQTMFDSADPGDLTIGSEDPVVPESTDLDSDIPAVLQAFSFDDNAAGETPPTSIPEDKWEDLSQEVPQEWEPVEIISPLPSPSRPAGPEAPTQPLQQSDPPAVPVQIIEPQVIDKPFAVIGVTSARAALLLDVTPRALGVATAGGFCDTIIERNAAIPVEQSRVFTTSHNDQTEVAVDVMQGESRRVDENTKLGEVLLSNLRPALRGAIKIRVTFEIDTDGILGVSARNEETGEAQSTKIVLTGGMDDATVAALVEKYADK